MWLGTFQGLLKIDLKGEKFHLYKRTIPGSPAFSSNSVTSVWHDNDENIWIGTSEGGLNHYNRKTGQVWVKQFGEGSIQAIFRDRINRLWVGAGSGVFVKDRNNDFVSLDNYMTENECIIGEARVNDFLEDKDGIVWIATSKGLLKVDVNKKKCRFITQLFYNDLQVDLNEVYTIVQDKDQYFWIGTSNGLIKYYPRSGLCVHYKMLEKVFKGFGLSSNTVYCLFDQDSVMWVGTTYGLNRLNKQLESFRLYDEKAGLPNNVINSIKSDKNGNLWISTNKGIVKFIRNNEQIEKYDVIDGLQGYEFFQRSSHVSPDGEIFFGGALGLNSVKPLDMVKNNNIPSIVITSFKYIDDMGNHTVLVKSGERIVLPPKLKMFSIVFSALDYTYPFRNRYAYQLINEGEKDEWISLGHEHTATFTNLAPGRYVFKVKGSNNDNVWNNKGVEIYLTVKAPLHRTRTAYISYIVVSVLLVLLVINVRTRNLRKSNRILREKELVSQQVARQKEELAVKNKDITDSINYAKRIQEAMMPAENLFDEFFSSSFILHKPKSIVSGDFYWINESGGKIFFAAVDCTGHGVPGAFMSLIGIELFRRITNIRGLDSPARILNILNKNFAEIFSDVGNITLRDGMDVALCVIDKENNHLEFAGAYNPLYIIRNNKILAIKGDRFSVGLDEYKENQQQLNFTNHSLDLESDDKIYIFTDGYIDQFGGPQGKKYKKRRFRHLLLNIHNYPMEMQKELLEKSIAEWQGSYDQVDDILIIGIKP
jgi:serine phosphatase RsbU (regulator of sigma subunit)